jgi:type I restriction enzyme R subunit
VPPALHGKPEAIVLFNNLPEILANRSSASLNDGLTEQAAMVALALNIDQVMREHAPAGWKGDETREKQVLNALFPLLFKDRTVTMAAFEIIKNQPGY